MISLIYGDNLEILREMEAGHIDLICTDPPFNSGRNYNAFFPESKAQSKAFEDIWKWDNEAIEARGDIRERADADNTYQALNMCLEGYDLVLQKSVSGNKGAMRAYLAFMGPRLAEMHRLLKNSGSIYLHCDPTASHYLKIVMDSLFGEKNFRNEIVWKRAITTKGNLTRGLARDSDIILRYSKTDDFIWNPEAVTIPYDLNNLDEKTKKQYRYIEEETGRRYSLTALNAPQHDANSPRTYEIMGITRTWRWSKSRMLKEIENGNVVQTKSGNVPRFKRYLDEQKGKSLNNIWIDISNLTGRNSESVGYPTQKPLALLDRIIKASSNEGDLVLDPFLGSGTTAVAAKRLNRSCIGIEINADCIEIAEQRIKENV